MICDGLRYRMFVQIKANAKFFNEISGGLIVLHNPVFRSSFKSFFAFDQSNALAHSFPYLISIALHFYQTAN